MSESERHSFEVWQDGIEVASVASANREEAQREAMHYALVYAQDGPVMVKSKTGSLLFGEPAALEPLSGEER